MKKITLSSLFLWSASLTLSHASITILDGTTSGTTVEGVSWNVLSSAGTAYASADTVGGTGEGYRFTQASGIRIEVDISGISPGYVFEGIRIQAIEGENNGTGAIQTPYTFNGVSNSTNTISFIGSTGATWDLSNVTTPATASAFTFSATDETLSASANTTDNSNTATANAEALSLGEDYGFFQVNGTTFLEYNNTGETNGQDGYAFALVVTQVPEPSSTALLGLGGLALLLRRTRK